MTPVLLFKFWYWCPADAQNSRTVSTEPLRCRANYLADGCAFADEQFHIAAELQRPADDGAWANGDRWRLAVAEKPAGFLDENAAVDAGIGTDVDVAARGFDVTRYVRRSQADFAVDVFDLALHVDPFVQRYTAVYRVDVAADVGARTDADCAIHGIQRSGVDGVAQRDRTVDGAGRGDGGVVANADRPIDGVQRAGGLAVLHADRAVDLAGVVALVERNGGAAEQQDRDKKDGTHGGSPGDGCLVVA